jgi:hypothetical protein
MQVQRSSIFVQQSVPNLKSLYFTAESLALEPRKQRASHQGYKKIHAATICDILWRLPD